MHWVPQRPAVVVTRASGGIISAAARPIDVHMRAGMRHAIMRSAIRSGRTRRRSKCQEADAIRLLFGGALLAVACTFGIGAFWVTVVVLGVALGCMPSGPRRRKPS